MTFQCRIPISVQLINSCGCLLPCLIKKYISFPISFKHGHIMELRVHGLREVAARLSPSHLGEISQPSQSRLRETRTYDVLQVRNGDVRGIRLSRVQTKILRKRNNAKTDQVYIYWIRMSYVCYTNMFKRLPKQCRSNGLGIFWPYIDIVQDYIMRVIKTQFQVTSIDKTENTLITCYTNCFQHQHHRYGDNR